MTKSYTWRTAAVTHETADTVTVVFDTGGAPFQYEPGQFINLTATVNGTRVTRSYSLSSCPGLDAQPAITVKQIAGGVMSTFIVQQAQHVREWEVEGPHGAFTPTPDTYKAGHVVLMAGGSGITPLYAIARSILHCAPRTQVTLLYSSRHAADVIFARSLSEMGLNVYFALSDRGPEQEGHGGRLNKLVAKKLVKQAVPLPHENAQYFICGPSGLIKLHQEVLEALQVPGEHIFTEWFNPEPAAPPVELPQQMQEVLFHFYDQYNLLEVQPGHTILAAALAEHIPVPYSCSAGTCGSCAARVTAGKVVMAGNYALRREDVEQGLVLLCQSYPLTEDVTVEIG